MIKGKKLPIININKTIYDAAKTIQNKKLGLVVIMKNKVVKGILTDGDARRGIKYYKKDDKLGKFISTNPIFVTESTPASKALAIMNEKKITSLLVTNSKNSKNSKKLTGIIHIHSLLQYGIK